MFPGVTRFPARLGERSQLQAAANSNCPTVHGLLGLQCIRVLRIAMLRNAVSGQRCEMMSWWSAEPYQIQRLHQLCPCAERSLEIDSSSEFECGSQVGASKNCDSL